VLDAVVANQRGPLVFYKNDVAPGRDWIAFDLTGRCASDAEPARTCSNRSAIGARATLHFNGQQQVQEVSGGSGFCAQNQRRLHFGLGANPKVEKVTIRWPSGKITEIAAPATGRVHAIKEP
jgi:hypothetical protein